MKKTKIQNFFEFLCLTLVLSYFFIHNIIFVIIGILFSIYLINIHIAEEYIKYINIYSFIKIFTNMLKIYTVSKDSKAIDNSVANLDSNLKLVDYIEESGFIPSINKNKDIDTA